MLFVWRCIIYLIVDYLMRLLYMYQHQWFHETEDWKIKGKDEEESESGLGLEGDIDSLRSERTQQEADRAWKKRLHKRREEHRKEIKKKREQRHKCRAQRVKENKLFNRWKTIVFG